MSRVGKRDRWVVVVILAATTAALQDLVLHVGDTMGGRE